MLEVEVVTEDAAAAADQAILSGGPDLGQEPDPEAALAAEVAEANAKIAGTVAAKPLAFKGLTKKIETADELSEYAQELERKQIALEAELSTLKTVRAPEAASTHRNATGAKRSYADKLFADPDGTIAEIRQELLSEVDQIQAKKEGDKAFWREFYTEFSDLTDFEETVQMKLNANREAYAKLPVNQARERLATEARAFLSKAKSFGSPSVTLPSKSASALGASAPSTKGAPAPERTKSFAEQIKGMRKARKTG